MTTHVIRYNGVLSDAIMGSQNFREIHESIEYSMEVRREPTNRTKTVVARIHKGQDGHKTEVDTLERASAIQWLVWKGSAAQIRTTDLLVGSDGMKTAHTVGEQSWDDRKLVIKADGMQMLPGMEDHGLAYMIDGRGAYVDGVITSYHSGRAG